MVAEDYKYCKLRVVWCLPGISSRVSETLESAPGPACENKSKKNPEMEVTEINFGESLETLSAVE